LPVGRRTGAFTAVFAGRAFSCGAGLCGGGQASASDVDWGRVNSMMEKSGYTQAQRNNIQKALKDIEARRKQERDRQRKEGEKRSLAAVKELYEKAQKAYKEQRYSAAYLYYSSVAASDLNEAAQMASEARAKVLEIEAMALGKVEEAVVLRMKKRPTEAADALVSVVEGFPYTEAAKRARRDLRALKSMPRVTAALRFAEGKAEEDAENYGGAVTIYEEVIRRWPEELAALRAREAMRKIKEDPEKARWVEEARQLEADRKCPTLLNHARNYILNSNNAKTPEERSALLSQAREKLNEVVREFPGTSYAEEAQRLLDGL